MTLSNFLDDELHRPSVFSNESVLSSNHVPENLLFRENELRTVVRHFKSLFTDKPTSKRLILHGKVGTGKTSIAKRFGIWATSQNTLSSQLRYSHVNCRMNRSPYTILLAIAKELNQHIPTRGFSSQELLEILIEMLQAQEMSLILVLDEIDYVQENELANLIYALTRVNEDKSGNVHQISLILISRSLSFLQHLDPSTQSTLSAASLYLETYSISQLQAIIQDRVNSSFKLGAVSNESTRLVSEIAGKKGDARHAIELLWFAGKYADQEQSPIVYPDHVRRAKNNLDPSLMRLSFDHLDLHKLLLSQAIIQRLLAERIAYTTTGDAEEAYQILCEEYNQPPRKHTQIW